MARIDMKQRYISWWYRTVKLTIRVVCYGFKLIRDCHEMKHGVVI